MAIKSHEITQEQETEMDRQRYKQCEHNMVLGNFSISSPSLKISVAYPGLHGVNSCRWIGDPLAGELTGEALPGPPPLPLPLPLPPFGVFLRMIGFGSCKMSCNVADGPRLDNNF